MHGKALALARRVGFPWDVIHATYQLAEADTRRGDLESGVAGLREALAGFSRLSPMDVWTNTTRASLAKALRSLGRYAEAAQLMDDALSFCVDSDAERIWAHGSWILETSAGLIAEHGEPHAASVIFGAAEACRVATDAEMPVWDLVQYEKDLGILTGRIGEAERAQAWGSGRSMAPEEAAAFARGHLRRMADRG
jgi:tetratricopeptide (TPR) repeat protein